MDINNYSYTPYMLDESEPTINKEPFYYWSNHDIRVISLDIAYMIPGYSSASLETKNFIYDRIQAKVTSLIEIS